MSATHANTTTATWHSQSLGEVTAIGDISLTADTVDTSTYNAADKFKTFVRGLIDGGEVPITCNYDASDTGQATFITDFYAGTSSSLVITFPTATGTTWTVPAIPTGLGTAQPMDGVLAITLTVKVTGKPTIAQSASTGLTTPFFVLSGSGDLTPAAAGDEYTYLYVLPNGTTSATVTPTASAGTITVNGSTVASGVASSAISIPEDAVTTITIVVTETNKSPKTYVIYAYQAGA